MGIEEFKVVYAGRFIPRFSALRAGNDTLSKWIVPFLLVLFMKYLQKNDFLFSLQPLISIVSENAFLTSRTKEVDMMIWVIFQYYLDGSFKINFSGCNLCCITSSVKLFLMPSLTE